MRFKWGGWKATRAQLAFWGSLATLTVVLLWAARAYPQWPWFSVWVLLLLTGVGVFSVPWVRRALAISWFGVTLLTLTGVSLANVFLYYVESHRQRSERLEVRGVYHDLSGDDLRVGVGLPGLDVALDGDPVRFERWGVDIAAAAGDTFVVKGAQDVESLRVQRGSAWDFPRAGRLESVLGRPLTTRASLLIESGTDSAELRLVRGSRRGVIHWAGSQADLSLDDPLLDRTFGRRLRQGIQLAELPWDSLPEVDGGDALLNQLVLTQTRPGRRLGRFSPTLPRYRVVSRSRPHIDPGTVHVLPGDTLWVRSRGSRWAFSLGRVPAVSRIAAPVAVLFVRRPRPTGWALPSAEACGSDANRCAIISSERLPPPQAHFDLGGFGLNAERYSFLARLETTSDKVDIVSAHDRVSFDYGALQPVEALSADPDDADAGYLMRVHRSDTSSRSAVLFTIVGLYGLLVSALLTLLGNPFLARRLRTETANTSAAWALLNLFVVFLGVRLVLGLRVAYAAPFYDRAAETSVGLWITFAIMLVFLGRWDAWIPTVWRAAERIRQPVRRLLLRSGLSSANRDAGANDPPPSSAGSHSGAQDPSQNEATRRGRSLASFGWVGLVLSLAGLVWQRPAAGLGVIVALIGLGAWVALGLFGASRAVIDRRRKGLSLRPVDVLTADFLSAHPSRAFTVAAGVAVVLALAIQAPIVALGPVTAGLALFALAALLERSDTLGGRSARAWSLYALSVTVAGLVVWVFLGLGPVVVATWAIGAVTGFLLLRRRLGDGEAGGSVLLVGYQALLEIGRQVFSGIAWTFVLGGLAGLAFLSFQQIPPFIRFALVFMLFLLAVRTGLVCRRVLDNSAPGARLTALGLLVIPLGFLLVFMLFDFGLGLVFFVPMMVTVLLAAEVDRLPRTLAAASAAVMVLVSLAAWSVLNPSVRGLEQAETLTDFSEEFAELGNPFVDALRQAGLSTPITRATVRSVAASNPSLIEEALAYAGSSEALLAAAPSLEQVWGGRAYAASGWTGTGLAGTTALGRGVPTVVSYAENAFSVYVVSEHGALGGIAVLLLYMSLLVVVAFWIVRVKGQIHRTPAGLAGLALTVGSVLWLVLPAVYVAASNLGLIPLTGQNMPFLGLNSWADVVLVSGIGTGVFVTLAGLTGKECGEEVTALGDPGARSGQVLGVFVYSLLSLSALALMIVAVGLVRQGDTADRRQGLEYRTLLTAVDEILELGDGNEVLRFDRFTAEGRRRTFELDSLSITEAGLAIPSLLPGGYLSEEVRRYNAFQRERAQIVRTDPAGFERLESYNPSLFRPYAKADGSLAVKRTASAWNRRVPSPFGERWAGDVRTDDAAVSWSLYSPEATVPLGRRVRLTRRIEGRRRSCEFEPDGDDTHAYCLSEARNPQVTLRGVGPGGGPQRLVSGWRSTRLDGERVAAGDSAALPAGSVVDVEPLGPTVFGRQWSGLLSTQQWINGRMRRRGEPTPPLDIVAALGRGPIDPDSAPGSEANVDLAISEARTTELTEQLETFVGGLPIPTEFATVVVARVSDGAVLAMAEVGTRSEPGRSRLLERVVPGSAVKPLLAAAVLSQRPELASLRIPARSGLVRQVGGAPRVPASEAFRTALNCGYPENGRVNLRDFLRCSNNEYAATLTLAGATLPGTAVSAVRAATDQGRQVLEGRRVLRSTLLESALTEGMRTLFDVSTDPTITDSNRRSGAVWTGLTFSDGTPALAPFEALPDASRPSLLGSSDSDGTDLSLLYRYSFGAWENRWNVLDLATAFGRVTTDRRIQLTLAGGLRPEASIKTEPVPLGLSEFDWYDDFLSGLSGVARNGTARGLAERWRRAGVPGTLFAKTGTLAEDEARRGSGLFIKSLLFAVGQTEEGPTTPLRCGLVGSVYLSFERGAGSGRLPSYQVEFAERRLARFLAEHWEEFGACPEGVPNRGGISAG